MTTRESWVFSLAAIEQVVGHGRQEAAVEVVDVILRPDHLCRFYFAAGDNVRSPLVIVIPAETLPHETRDSGKSALQRLAWLARDAQRGGVQLPSAWSPFHRENLVAFFVSDRSKNVGSGRWIVRIDGHGGVCDIVVLERTEQGGERQLSEFSSDSALQARLADVESRLRAAWESNRESALLKIGERVEAKPPIVFARDIYQLAPPRESSRPWTLEEALGVLTAEQKQVVMQDAPRPTFVQGVAGSGKSLCLALRSILEARRAGGAPRRILVLTHSWQVAFSIDELIGMLLVNDVGVQRQIEVTPLLALAEAWLMRRGDRGSLAILGTDSDEGKQQQLARIDVAIRRIREENWRECERGLSPELRDRFEESGDPRVRRPLAWDLMIEFSDVLGANRILPGYRALEKYIKLPRTPWMLARNEYDCAIILKVYEAYVAALQANHCLSSDQAISDYLGILTSYDWDARRSQFGYDFIAVDEYHLFSRQERLCIEHLRRDRNSYPAVLYAQDETQTPSARYVGEAYSAAHGQVLDDSDCSGEVLALHSVHRFGRKVLQLVKHILRTHPAIETDYELMVAPDSLISEARSHEVECSLHIYQKEEDVRRALSSVEPSKNGRLAILVADSSRAQEYCDLAVNSPRLRAIGGIDDIQSLSYSPRAVLIGSAAEVAGLQFDEIIVVGVRDVNGLSAGQRIALTNQLYLAITRSRGGVRILASLEMSIPEVLESAIKMNLIDCVKH